jgi:hypothetical protein
VKDASGLAAGCGEVVAPYIPGPIQERTRRHLFRRELRIISREREKRATEREKRPAESRK